MRNLLKVGDTIQCRNKDDAVTYMTELAKVNIETDFMYEKDGVEGLWLVVEKVGGMNDRTKF